MVKATKKKSKTHGREGARIGGPAHSLSEELACWRAAAPSFLARTAPGLDLLAYCSHLTMPK